MIPEEKVLRKKCRKQGIKFRQRSYFEDAEELVLLKKRFQCETVLDSVLLALDMFIYPIYVLVRLCLLDFSISYIFGMIKTYQVWCDWFRICDLQRETSEWKRIVRSVGGPWISSNTEEYHIFVYADGMERINSALKKIKTT
jgi:hypothetical protein